jgi:hypothetical protein
MTNLISPDEDRTNPAHAQHLAAVQLLHEMAEEAAQGTGHEFAPLQWTVGVAAELRGTPPPGPDARRLRLLTMWADNLGMDLDRSTKPDGRTVYSCTTTMTNLYDQNVTVTLHMESDQDVP